MIYTFPRLTNTEECALTASWPVNYKAAGYGVQKLNQKERTMAVL